MFVHIIFGQIYTCVFINQKVVGGISKENYKVGYIDDKLKKLT